ncbi:hypothetical protein FPOAC2_02222 [Fusarium poae]|jgi:hypothetical protein
MSGSGVTRTQSDKAKKTRLSCKLVSPQRFKALPDARELNSSNGGEKTSNHCPFAPIIPHPNRLSAIEVNFVFRKTCFVSLKHENKVNNRNINAEAKMEMETQVLEYTRSNAVK